MNPSPRERAVYQPDPPASTRRSSSLLGLLLLAAACGRDITYATSGGLSPVPGEGVASAARDEGGAASLSGADPAGASGPDDSSGTALDAELDGETGGAGDGARDLSSSERPGGVDAGASARGPDAGGPGAATGVSGAASCWLSDGPTAASALEGQGVALPCLLAVEWGPIRVTGPAGCEALSSTLEATWFEWQGGALAPFDPAATPLASVGATLERMRRCEREVDRGVELWRFEERFELGAALPTTRCPSQPFGARYHYTEHGRLPGPGSVFGADQAEACQFDACVRFVPSPAAVAQAPAASESRCAPPSLPDEPTHAAAIGERCRLSYECEAGSFCSLERDDGSCAFPGEELCQRAPRIDECSAELGVVCPCYREPITDTSRCEQNARGVSVGACP